MMSLPQPNDFRVEKRAVRQSGDILHLFVSAVQGQAIGLASETVQGFSVICSEFQF
jgi:hypothetical protein